MEHHHHHHDHHVEAGDLHGIYIVCIVLNLAFVFIEAGVGIWSKSLGLVSDAGHNLGDVLGLVLALVAFKLSMTSGRKGFTYGYRKASVLISMLNAFILLVAVGAIIYESIVKISHPVSINGSAIAWTAGVGIIVNGLTTVLLMKHQKHDINTRGAFLHMAADTLVSIGVVISGIIIKYTGWSIIDPVISLVIAAIILVSTWHLLSESIRMSIDAVPESVDIEKINEIVCATEGVKGMHHVHVWPISTTETAMTAHIVVNEYADGEKVVPAVKSVLRENGISHPTLEVEAAGCNCQETSC